MRIQTKYDAVHVHSTSAFQETNIIQLLPKGTLLDGAELEADWWRVGGGFIHASMVERIKLPIVNIAGQAIAPHNPLSVPYRSQWDRDADNRISDCGQTCVAMLAQWRGIHIEINDLRFQQTDSGITNWNDLVNNFGHVGLSAQIAFLEMNASVPKLPAICLMWYGGLERNSVQDKNFKGWHWAVLLEQNVDHVIVHDPDFWGQRRSEGDKKRYALEEWNRAFIPYEPSAGPRKVMVMLSE